MDRLHAGAVDPAADLALLDSVITHWAAHCEKLDHYVPCSECGARGIYPFDATDHCPSCPNHLGRRRLRALKDLFDTGLASCPVEARDALRDLLGAGVAERRVWNLVTSELYARMALDRLTKHRASCAAKELGEAAAGLRNLATECERVLDRGTDPCPHCRGSFPLGEFPQHLLACAQHPCMILADQLETRVTGVAADVLRELLRKNRLRDEYAVLRVACDEFRSDMGWDGEQAYSTTWSERPWHTAREHARKVLDEAIAGAATPSAPETERIRKETAVWAEALKRLLAGAQAYWDRMGDGDRGRSLSDASNERRWDAVRVDVAAMLGGFQNAGVLPYRVFVRGPGTPRPTPDASIWSELRYHAVTLADAGLHGGLSLHVGSNPRRNAWVLSSMRVAADGVKEFTLHAVVMGPDDTTPARAIEMIASGLRASFDFELPASLLKWAAEQPGKDASSANIRPLGVFIGDEWHPYDGSGEKE